MQRKKRHIIQKLLAAAVLLALWSCSNDTLVDEVSNGADSGSQATEAYIQFAFSAPGGSATRANPSGGEDGDGAKEHGQRYESVISDAVVFLYQDDNGVNGEASTPVYPYYFDELMLNSINPSDDIDRTYLSKSVQVDVELGTYKVLAVANPGTDAWWETEGLTLGDVRDHIEQTAWTENGGVYSYFMMSSERDAEVTIDETSKSTSPARAEVYVERLAARIDYQADAEYTCQDESYSGATIKITGACLVNNLTAGSYLMKRVADYVGATTVSYLGDEEAATDGSGLNYVLDPWTVDKTPTNLSGTPFSINGTSVSAAALFGTWWGDADANSPAWWNAKAVATTTISDDNGDYWQRIGYTMENTTDAACSDWRYNTAVIFKAEFTPVGVENYEAGNTFFAFGNHLFASMEDLMAYVYKDEVSTFDTKIDNCTTWADVTTFANSLLDNDPSGYKTFLKSQATGQTGELTDTEKTALKWKAYMLAECGYSATLSNGVYNVSLDQNGVETATVLADFETRTYVDAQCYYTWWVRHANDENDSENGIMEFAIVRNSIYKLIVEGIYSLGGYVPGDESLIIDVYVKDWTLLADETLEM